MTPNPKEPSAQWVIGFLNSLVLTYGGNEAVPGAALTEPKLKSVLASMNEPLKAIRVDSNIMEKIQKSFGLMILSPVNVRRAMMKDEICPILEQIIFDAKKTLRPSQTGPELARYTN